MTSTDSRKRLRPDKVTLIAVWFGISAAFSLFSVAALLFILLPEVVADPDRGLVLAVGSGFFLVGGFGVADIAAVVGVLRLREWGRWLAISLSILGLIVIPIGTIVGWLIIRYLLSDEAKQAFGVPLPPPPGHESIQAAQSEHP